MNLLPPIIGIAGRAGAGKDTLAFHLTQVYGYTRYGFADPIKMLLNERFGWTTEMWDDRDWKENKSTVNGSRFLHTPEGDWEHFSPRSWAQWLGTEVGRNCFGEDCWVNLMEKTFKKEREKTCNLRHPFQMVIPDVRFLNEARRIQALGGEILNILRPGDRIASDHPSEAGLPDSVITHYLYNNKDIPHLLKQFDQLYANPLA